MMRFPATGHRLISEAFDEVCARAGARVAIRGGDRDLPFRELLHWTQSISRLLEPALREPGQRVALILPNSAAFVAAFFGIARVGGVVAPLSPRYRTQEILHYLNDLDATAVVGDFRFLQRARDLLPALKRTPAVLDVSGQAARLIERGQGPGQALRSGTSPPLLQQYTSGSTGVPKRIVRSHASVLAELEALRRTFDLSERDRFLGAAPFSHVNGLVRTMLTAMTVGAALYTVEEFRRREILDVLTRERITFFGGVPPMFVILSQTPVRGDEDLSALRVVFSSSAPLLPADNRQFHERFGVWIRQLYGSTETGTISVSRRPDPEECLESVGTPLDGVRVEVVDDSGTRLPPDHEGELVIASPFAAAEYLDNPIATAESFRHGRYFSGDLGRKSRAGDLILTGRRKLFLNRGGFKVNPYEVEAVIKQYPKVAAVAVFGVPGRHGDDIVCCCIVPSARCTTQEILAHCSERLAEFKIPARVEFREALPTTPSGKILRTQLSSVR
jgi:long-chain acyl-CoA synthetase